MKILIVSLHVRHSPQAVALAAGNLKAALPQNLQEKTQLLSLDLQQSTAQMLETIQQVKADLVAFSLYLWNRKQALLLAGELKKMTVPPFILCGGPEASADSTRLLKTGLIDAVLRGEGEESFSQLVTSLARNQPLTEIPGLSLDPAQPPAAACCCEIDNLPSPWLTQVLRPVAGGVLWEVARGCPFHCSFCYDAKGMAGVRPFPEERLTAELEHFVANGTEQVWVLDSTFNAPAKRGKKLLKLLIEKAPQLHYHLEAKAEFIDNETIDLLSQLSCSIQLGLQTADSNVLAELNRKINAQRFWTGVELVANSGLTFGLDLIYGLPGDSYLGFCNSINKALAYRPNQVDIFPLAVLPGTQLFGQKQQLQLNAADLPPYLLESSSDFPTELMQKCTELKAAVDLLYNRGRAVGFFLPFCSALRISPLNLLKKFRDWFINSAGEGEVLCENDQITIGKILTLQHKFLKHRFEKASLLNLWPLANDIINYHNHYAEALLGPETLPQPSRPPRKNRFQLAAGVHLLKFEYDLLGALEAEEIDLPRWHRLIERTATSALMIRRGSEVLCEVLTDGFAELLDRARKPRTRAELTMGLSAEMSHELFDFALQEGLLVLMETT